jgi:hypothetical protein
VGTQQFRPNPAALVQQIIDRIPCLFGSLIYLAGTWDSEADSYCEPCLGLHCSSSEIDCALRRKHREVFADWLALPLDGQADDLRQYLDATSENRTDELRSWMRNRSYVISLL